MNNTGTLVRAQDSNQKGDGAEKSVDKECGCESTILIVDDNFFNLIPLELILSETFQLSVDKALNGADAVAKFRKAITKKCCNIRYKLILMDLNMPVMDGYRAAQEILKMHATFI